MYIVVMRISSKSKITFQVLLDVAAHTAKGKAISIPLLCRRHKLSHSYLEIIFGILKSAGYIRSFRGPGGGYSLLKKPQDISLFDVVCLVNDQSIMRDDLCTHLWNDLDFYMSEQMKKVNLASELGRLSIEIEAATKGMAIMKMASLTHTQTSAEAKKSNKTVKPSKPRLGPNSVFTLGRYLQSN
ncbi:BadM/Rrf2 family transcriptional regulator [beta proteobacterium CB]|nr:BadM/Rrf2 family transcriptional regulator [beta proteobacterium CB]